MIRGDRWNLSHPLCLGLLSAMSCLLGIQSTRCCLLRPLRRKERSEVRNFCRPAKTLRARGSARSPPSHSPGTTNSPSDGAGSSSGSRSPSTRRSRERPRRSPSRPPPGSRGLPDRATGSCRGGGGRDGSRGDESFAWEGTVGAVEGHGEAERQGVVETTESAVVRFSWGRKGGVGADGVGIGCCRGR